MTTAQTTEFTEPHYLSPAGLAKKVDRRWKLAPHLNLLCAYVVECVMTFNGRLIIECPPRHGKSELVSHYTPPWVIGTWPEKRVILTSYEADFAATWGRKSRDVLEQHGEELYGVRPQRDSHAADRWEVEALTPDGWEQMPGGMVTAGVAGPITGKGGDVIVIDDPVKNAEDSMSIKKQLKAWDWFESTLTSRYEPGASAIIIMTRWNELDLVGRIKVEMLENPKYDKWKIITLPAIATEDEIMKCMWATWTRRKGEALWPARFDIDELRRRQANRSAYWWQALYQQDPLPQTDMATFKDAQWGYVDAPPLMAEGRVRYWDLAATQPKDPTDDPDFTVGVLMSRYRTKFTIEDVQRFRKNAGDVENEIIKTARADGRGVPIRIEQEPGAAGKSLIAYYVRALPGWDIRGIPSTGNKQLRADPLAAQAVHGNVDLIRHASWLHDWHEEVKRFPYGVHDDQVDAASGAFTFLAGDMFAIPTGIREIGRPSPWKI